MTIYRFDEVGESLHLVPVAARRALDHAGVKLSLTGWRSLPLELRQGLVQVGVAAEVDVDHVKGAMRRAEPPAKAIEPTTDPPSDAVPAEVREAFGPERDIPDSLWASLTRLDRFALAKAAEKRRPDRLAQVYDEIVGQSSVSTHLAPGGGVRMIDVAEKRPSKRRAVAESRVTMNEDAFGRLARADAPKGDVLGAARLAGIMAAKRTSDIVPLCHPLSLTHVGVELELERDARAVRVTATVEAFDRTGVEMEALHAASASALTVYDMLKAFDRAMVIGPTQLLAKSGGRSGDYER